MMIVLPGCSRSKSRLTTRPPKNALFLSLSFHGSSSSALSSMPISQVAGISSWLLDQLSAVTELEMFLLCEFDLNKNCNLC